MEVNAFPFIRSRLSFLRVAIAAVVLLISSHEATKVTLDPSSTKTVTFAPATQSSLHIEHPKLWWPVGYGDPDLYPVSITFTANAKVSDTKSFKAGIRQFTYSEDGGVLKIWVNGRRFIARGGNWGFPESMLRYRAREYDTAMRYHRDEPRSPGARVYLSVQSVRQALK